MKVRKEGRVDDHQTPTRFRLSTNDNPRHAATNNAVLG